MFDWQHDIRVAFFHAKGSGRVLIIPSKGLAPPVVGWKCVKAWYRHERRASVGEMRVVAPMMFVSENHGHVIVYHGHDFVSCGSAVALDEIDRVLMANFDTMILR